MALALLLPAIAFPGAVIGLCGTAALLLYLKKTGQNIGDPWLFRLFLIGFSLRFLIICLFAALSSRPALDQDGIFTFSGDSLHSFLISYDALTAYIGNHDYIDSSLQPGFYAYNVLNWVRGAIYYLAGYSPFLLMLSNITAGCLAAWMIYLTAYRITNHQGIASWAMGLTLLLPSQILWSVILLKEPVIALYLTVIIYLFVDMIVRKRWKNLLFLGFLWYPIGHIRIHTELLTLWTLVLSMIVCIPRRRWVRVLLLILPVFVIFMTMGSSWIENRYRIINSRIIRAQYAFFTTGGAYYQFIPDRYQAESQYTGPMTLRELTTSYLKSLYYYLGSPNPFTALTINKLPALPQMVLWYIMMILFFPIGALYLLRYRFRSSGIIFVFLFIFTSAFALNTGNEGTAFRHRDILTPFYFILIATGMFNFRGWLAKKYARRSSRLFSPGEL